MVALPKWLQWGRKDQLGISLRDLIFASSTGKAGINVTWESALQAVTALACARVIAEGLAQIPLKLHKDRPDGGSDVMKGDRLYKLVNASPNEFITSYEWRETMGLHLVFAGDAYNIIVRAMGNVVELLPLNPKDVTVERDGYAPVYKVQVRGKAPITVQAKDMLHIKGISWDGLNGLDGVRMAAEAIGLALATEEHGARLFANGAQPGGVLTTEANLTDPATRKALKESWDETHAGLKNAGKTALLWGGLKWASTTQQNDQAQFLETRAFQVEEVCRWARVMPIMVGHSDKSMTFASAEQIFLSHVVHTMGPWYARVEQALDRALLTQKQRDEGYYFKFNVSALMRGSHADRSAYFSKALGAGGSPAWMTQDEVRALDELNPLGGDAARLPVATNVAPAPTADPELTKAVDDIRAELKSIPREHNIIVNNGQPSVNFKAGDTALHMPEGMVKVDTQVTTPEVNFKAGDVHVETPPAQVVVSHPTKSVQKVERDDKMEIVQTVTTHEYGEGKK